MIEGKTVLAIITARGGSKGVKDKNIRPLAGKPLITWTIDAARASRSVDRVVVTTDSDAIAQVARDAGADVPFLRPAEYAGDLSKQEDAFLHAMRWVETNDKRYDFVMLLAPTNPLRDAAEIDAVSAALVANPHARAIFTVIPASHHPFFMNTLPADGSLKGFVPEEHKLKNRQELPAYYALSASVCILEWDHFVEHQSFLTPETYAFVTTEENGHDINSPLDFAVAEALMAARLRS